MLSLTRFRDVSPGPVLCFWPQKNSKAHFICTPETNNKDVFCHFNIKMMKWISGVGLTGTTSCCFLISEDFL